MDVQKSGRLSDRPQTISENLDVSFRLFWNALKVPFLLFLIGGLLASLPYIAFAFVGVPSGVEIEFNEQFWIMFLMFLPIILVWSMISYGGATYHFLMAARGQEAGFGDCVKVGLRRALQMFFLWILFVLAVLLGLLLLVIPGIYLMLALAPAFVLVVSENRSAVDAFSRSLQLVRNNWWRTALVVTIPVIVAMALMSVVGVIGVAVGIFAAVSGDELSPERLTELMVWLQVVSQLLSAPVNAVAYPLMLAVMLCWTHDLSLRRDGGDLQARIEAMSA